MKISFEKKSLGFVINLLVVIAAGGSSFRALIIKETKRWIRYWTG
jgi:hypothetical protein